MQGPKDADSRSRAPPPTRTTTSLSGTLFRANSAQALEGDETQEGIKQQGGVKQQENVKQQEDVKKQEDDENQELVGITPLLCEPQSIEILLLHNTLGVPQCPIQSLRRYVEPS